MQTDKTSGEQEKRVVLQIGGEKLDLTDYPPITQGDKKRLRQDPYHLNFVEMDKWDEEKESLFVLFLLKRVRPNTTLAEVDDLPAKIVQDVASYCMRKSAQVELPFSRPSTSSLVSTGGEKGT